MVCFASIPNINKSMKRPTTSESLNSFDLGLDCLILISARGIVGTFPINENVPTEVEDFKGTPQNLLELNLV